MSATLDTRAVVRGLNVLGALTVFGVVIGAYGVQFVGQEAPCPLCLLIRLGMIAVGFGFLLNARFGPQPLHYGFILLAAFFGAAVSIRQILLHIVPGTGAYGDPVLGFHLYTWAFLVFSAVILAVATAMFFDRQFAGSKGPSTGTENPPAGTESAGAGDTTQPARAHPTPALVLHATTVAFVIGIVLAALNLVTTGIECGIGFCPDNPGPGAFG